MPTTENFFEKPSEKSKVKTLIVTEFLKSYFPIINRSVGKNQKEIIYIDLFCGPGKYNDGHPSTPLVLLDLVNNLGKEGIDKKPRMIFNDKKKECVYQLRKIKESINTAFNYFRANKQNISGSISLSNSDFLMHTQDLQGIGMTLGLILAAFVALCSGALKKPVRSQMAILGSMSVGGTISKVEELVGTLQVCFDAGAKKVLLPMASATDIATVPPELFAKFQISFYQSPEDAVFKALGIE